MKSFSILWILSLLVLSGCDCDKRGHTETRTTTTISGQTHLLSVKDFDLQTVMSLIKDNKVNGAEELEKIINSDNGINNVDLDKDGHIDPISVKERRVGNDVHLDMIAVPSKTKDPSEGVVVASVSFSKNTTTNAVETRGGYPNYVHGHNTHHYHHHHRGLTFGEAMFLAWIFTPRPMYYRPAFVGGFAPRPVYTPSRLATQRTTYRKQTKMSPVRKSSKPKGYNISPAKKVPSRFKKQLSSSNTFKDRAGSSTKFKSRAGKENKKSSWGSGSSRSRSSWGSGSSRSSFSGSRSGRRSDATFKEGITRISGALDKVSKINGVYFNFKGEDIKRSGVIAQNVNSVFPVVVSTDNKGYLVDYAGMVPLLIEAIKELKEENRKIHKKCGVK